MQYSKKPILVDNRDWRSKCGEQEQIRLLLKSECDQLPQTNGVVVDERLVRHIDCPVCGAADKKQLFLKTGFRHVTCRRCGHVFVDNPLRPEYAESLYCNSAADNQNLALQQNTYHRNYWDRVYAKYFEIAVQLCGENPNILDVGCGVGNFLKFVQRHPAGSRYRLHGLELNRQAAARVEKIVGPANFYNQRMEDIDFKKFFGQIYLWGVLEHISSPLSVLGRCHQILSPDGLLTVLIPNFESLAVRILGVQTPTFEPRSHIQFFTAASLAYVCDTLGFTAVDVFFELPVIDLMYPYVDYSPRLAQTITDDGEGYYRVHLLRKNPSAAAA